MLREEVDHYSLHLKDEGQDQSTSVLLLLSWLHWSAACSSLVFPGCVRRDTVLSVQMNNPIMHHNCRGQRVELTFDSEHHEQLEEAVRRVFKVSLTGFQ